MRYDAAIIGAGAEGLAAATILGRAGLRVLVIERGERAGGRCRTHEFHPGFRASPFADTLASIPADLFWTLGLARHGAVAMPERASLALWPGRAQHLSLSADDRSRVARFLAQVRRRRSEILARVAAEAETQAAHGFFGKPRAERWASADWASFSLEEAVADATDNADEAAHLTALALEERIADPHVAGSALHLLGLGASGGRFAGGLGWLGEALVSSALAAGVEFSFGLEASDILRRDGRIQGVGLADGSEIAAASVVSTLDLKRTFLTFFAWNALPKEVAKRVNAFRMAGGIARVLFALERAPELPAGASGGNPIHVAPDIAATSEAYHVWRAGILAPRVPVTLRVVSDGDPSLAPPLAAVVTATLSGVPVRLFDGAWTHEKRELLRSKALAAAESVSPGFTDRVIGSDVIMPPDIEDALGATDGDLAGGEIAGDQMLGEGPWDDRAMPRTPIAGLYAAGSYLTAGAFATCAAGAAAARALIADRARGRIK